MPKGYNEEMAAIGVAYTTANKFEDSPYQLTKYSNFFNKSLMSETNEQDGDETHCEFQNMNNRIPILGKSFDYSLTPLEKGSNNFLLHTVEQTYAVVDNPFVLGTIACSDILTTVYSSGIQTCDKITVTLTLSVDIPDDDHNEIFQAIVNGLMDCGRIANVDINIGCFCIDRYCFLETAASTLLEGNECINVNNAVDGDVVILTKPLGIYVALTAYKWLNDPVRWNKMKSVVSRKDVENGYNLAIRSMMKLNKWAVPLMIKYEARSITKVSNLGILGHAQILASRQKNPVMISIHNLPIISKMAAISRISGNEFQILHGNCPEISGGLLFCLSQKNAAAFRIECERELIENCWIVGTVKPGNRTAEMIRKPRVIDFPSIK